MELLEAIRAERDQENTSKLKKTTNQKQPIYSRKQQKIILNKIKGTLDPYYLLFWEISVATGWRTSDVLRMLFKNINLKTGDATIIISKQTKAAEARAFRAVLTSYKERLKKQVIAENDHAQYMKIDMCPLDKINELLTPDELKELKKDLIKAINKAPVMRDKKRLPNHVLKIIKERTKTNKKDSFIFSKSLAFANTLNRRVGHISRQTIWAGLKSVFIWFKNTINSKLNLSAYSSRKTFAYRMLKGVSLDQNNISEVMEAFGHSSVKMTFKYLCLESNAQQLQNALLDDD
jgi:integrase